MNFYKHHLGDYAAATSHLSWDEDCAYRRLIDQYYKRESPLPAEIREACRLARATNPAQRRAVETVLKEFFTLSDDGWHQKRCDEEISSANAQADTNRRIAEEREAKKRARTEHESLHANGNEQNTNRAQTVDLARLQTPDSRQIPSEGKPSGGKPPAVNPPTARDMVFATGVPLITAAGVKESNARSMLAMLCKKHGEEVVSEAIDATASAHPGDPVSWLQAVLKPKPNAAPRRGSAADQAPAWEGAK